MMNWVEKYSPKTTEHFIGQSKQKKRFLEFIENYDKEKKKAVLLWGPPGTGKTLLPIITAKEKGYELLEFNASDKRSKEMMERTLSNVANMGSIFGNKKIILIDDADCFGRSDRGGLNALINVIKKTKYPIVLTAQDYWDRKMAPLRKYVLNIHLDGAEEKDIAFFLHNICNAEGIKDEAEALMLIARKNENDIRASLLDLQIIAQCEKEVTKQKVALLNIEPRKTDLKKTIMKLSKAKTLQEGMNIIMNSEEAHDELFLWIQENIPFLKNNPRELMKSYENMAVADVFNGRIIKKQYWGFLTYKTLLMSGVVMQKNISRIEYPRKIRKLFENKSRDSKAKALSEKLSKHIHASKSTIRKEYLPFLRKMVEKNGKNCEDYGLDEEDVAFLLKYY